MKTRLVWLVVLAGALSACNGREYGRLDPRPVKEARTDIPVDQNRDLDLLFVIDNSRSMAAEQQQLAQNFFRIIEALEGPEGLPSLHIGVITTDMGAAGACPGNPNAGQLVPPSCAGAQDLFLADLANDDGSRTRNYNGDLRDAFSCVAQVGATGCGFEQPLESMRSALSTAAESGFLRENAYLGVIFIGDEDDCSTMNPDMFGDPLADLSSPLGPLHSFRCFEFGVVCDEDTDRRALGGRSNCRPREDSPYMFPVGGYADFLGDLKPYPGQLILASIAGPTSPVEVVSEQEPTTNQEVRALGFTCGDASSAAQAMPPIRLDAFLGNFPDNITQAPICNEDLGAAVQQIADFFGTRTRPCLVGDLVDVDQETEGLQVECNVAESQADAEGRITEKRLAECSNPENPEESATLPCFTIQADAECENTETGLALSVTYPPGYTVIPGTRAIARCAAR